jgi:rifampin ADP-ribosylating transferase
VVRPGTEKILIRQAGFFRTDRHFAVINAPLPVDTGPDTYLVLVAEALDPGPFFHGTKADLRTGDLLTAGFRSNYRPEIVMNHIYFTALPAGAGLAAELAAGQGAPRVYTVEPTGAFENDPNVTDKKFPGNPTRSFRSKEPLRVTGEVSDWPRLTPEALQTWRDRLAAIRADERAEIIN